MIKKYNGWLYQDKETGIWSLDTVLCDNFTGASKEDVIGQAQAAHLKRWINLSPRQRDREIVDFEVEVPDHTD